MRDRAKKYYYQRPPLTKKQREEKKAYHREYNKTYKKKVLTRTERDALNLSKRERYANDLEFREHCKKMARNHASKNPEYRKISRLREKGLTPEQHAKMFKKQKGKCAICRTPPAGEWRKSLHIDHCHKTGKIRGLLCGTCNMALGQFKDSPKLLEAAKKYLSKSSCGAT